MGVFNKTIILLALVGSDNHSLLRAMRRVGYPLGSLSNEDSNGNENIISKYKLLVCLSLSRLLKFASKMLANCPGTKLV